MRDKLPCTVGSTLEGPAYQRGMDESVDESAGRSGTEPPGAASVQGPRLWTGTSPTRALGYLAGTVTTPTRPSTTWCGWALTRGNLEVLVCALHI